ncbi:50S ribosome-binding GTPase [Corynebacterium breve]|uniref:50S ribosome-binding GTPase n=2 Tax=Corynebacterium breve TaxID=3049799 RepID=A0ABY8VHA4_9CORY|nr:dynamin family protein [Corynebacterium breve]WIM69061.1 50S ribosome-binding GTPase [Corynebacterium breve]
MNSSRVNVVGALNTLLLQAADALQQGGGDMVNQAETVRTIVNRPPQVAVAGRLKSGKSTLVNALTQHKIAATGSLECTMAVSIYSDGAPARAEIHDLDGGVRRISLADGPLTGLGRPLDEIDYIHQYLPNRELRQLGLIDTPGTATLTVENEQRTRRVLVDGQKDTARASAWADSVVFLSDSTPRDDEREFLATLGMTPLTLVGVLSRADSFGAGAFGDRDPIEHAASHSQRIVRELGGAVSAVLPLSGLLAESALTGQITEDFARMLAALAPLSRTELLDVLELPDPSSVGPGLNAQQRDWLLDTVGEYGIFIGRNVAAQSGAVGLMRWMVEASGLQNLTNLLTGDLTYYSLLQRAARVLDILDELAGTHAQRDHARWVQSVTVTQPAMQQVLLYRSFQRTYRSSPMSRLVPMLHQAITATSPAGVAGLTENAPESEVRDALNNKIVELQQMAMAPLSAAEEEARTRLVVAHQEALNVIGG